MYYRPAGFRQVKQILIGFNEADKAVLDELNKLIADEEALIRAIDQLSEENRQIVICKYLFEMSSAEIGDIMNLQEKTVNVRLFRARKQLQELLKQEVWR